MRLRGAWIERHNRLGHRAYLALVHVDREDQDGMPEIKLIEDLERALLHYWEGWVLSFASCDDCGVMWLAWDSEPLKIRVG